MQGRGRGKPLPEGRREGDDTSTTPSTTSAQRAGVIGGDVLYLALATDRKTTCFPSTFIEEGRALGTAAPVCYELC